jgi:hypothetical protein
MQRFLLLRAALVGVHADANEGIGVERGGVVLRVDLSLRYKSVIRSASRRSI